MMGRRAFGVLAALLVLAGCQGPGATSYGGPVAPLMPTGSPAASRVAILLPLTGSNAGVGQAMLKAAQLAYEGDASSLDTHDTGGTPAGAAAAARAAVTAGDGLVLGPLTSAETAAAAAALHGAVPMLAFTSDAAQAQPGVWTLGITPEQQVRRLVAAVQAQGRTKLAALLPDNPFGRALADAYLRAAVANNLPPPNIRRYAGSFASLNEGLRAISDYANRRGPIEAKIREARERHDAESRQQIADLSHQPIPPPPFDTLLLAASGEALQEAASLLPYYDVRPSEVRLLGPALWATEAPRLGALAGAWYAAPDPTLRSAFEQRYGAKYGVPPPRLADLAYDAASLARLLAAGPGFSVAALTRRQGFAGVDGVLALQPDGQVRRGLAIFEIGRGGAQIVEPSPETVTAPGV